MTEATGEFERYRPLLLGLAYRLLGSMWDAEDVVSEAYLRWRRADTSEVREVRAYLITVTSRLALDQLRSARVTREAYRGPWLPEPVPTEALGPLDTTELRDTVSYATLHLMERLAPPERAVFVLRAAFDLPYRDIASVLGTSVANCRQLRHRAGRRLAEGREVYRPSREDHEKLLAGFLAAARDGDLAALTDLLSADVTSWNDGGGMVRAAPRPVTGRETVAAFLAALTTRYPIDSARVVDANGAPALWVSSAGEGQLVVLNTRDGKITEIFAVRDPRKLRRFQRAGS